MFHSIDMNEVQYEILNMAFITKEHIAYTKLYDTILGLSTTVTSGEAQREIIIKIYV